MSSLKTRVKTLEGDLKARPMRHYSHTDLPFAVFCYPPREEWAMRKEIQLLQTRLEHESGRRITRISLADLLWEAVERCEGIEAVAELERSAGFDAAQRQVQDYLSDEQIWMPLRTLLKTRLAPLDPEHDLVFLVRAGALAPNLYRVSKLLDEMKGQTRVPCVLFMPATNEGSTSIRFMGIAENEGRGSYHTKVYS